MYSFLGLFMLFSLVCNMPSGSTASGVIADSVQIEPCFQTQEVLNDSGSALLEKTKMQEESNLPSANPEVPKDVIVLDTLRDAEVLFPVRDKMETIDHQDSSFETVTVETSASSLPAVDHKSGSEDSIQDLSYPGLEIQELAEGHTIWDELLKKYVSNTGNVNYPGLKRELNVLSSYLDWLASTVPGASDVSDEALAFWINAYNAFTVKLILDNYPVQSIRDLNGGNPWDRKWIVLGDQSYSLNNIEHDIIRKRWKEPRIHFAVNCAARSCPPLANKAFTSGNLNSLLDAQTRKFINNEGFNVITAKKMTVSRIFQWYKGDFDDLVAFIRNYSDVSIDKRPDIEYMEYDWKLNGK